MKKTMFITSVIMVVVMAIALTTSSLAWFSASSASTVGTSAVTISAKTNASQGLYIARSIEAFQTGTIKLTAGASEQYIPVVPYGASAADTAANILYALQRDQFVGNATKTEAGVSLWADKYSVSNANFYRVTDLYVANSGSVDATVSASISISETHGATLNVAVLARHESALLPKINGDTNNNGVIDGTITIGTGDNAVVYNYVGRVGIKTANVYGVYIDEDNDGQITAEETTTLDSVKTANDGNYTIGGAAETYNSESAYDYEHRYYDEANINKWELLAYKNSKNAANMYLGRYSDAPNYKTYVNPTGQAPGTYYKLVKANSDPVWVLTSDAATLAEKLAAEYDYDERLDVAEQNNFFEQNVRVDTAYNIGGVEPTINSETSFVLHGTKRMDANGTLIEEQYGDYMQVKVLAWYSVDLSNSNSGAYNATSNPFGTSNDFTITFNRVDD